MNKVHKLSIIIPRIQEILQTNSIYIYIYILSRPKAMQVQKSKQNKELTIRNHEINSENI